MPQAVTDYVKEVLRRSATISRSSPLTVLRDGRCQKVGERRAEEVDQGGIADVAERGELPFKRLLDASKSSLREKGERSLHLICGRLEIPWPNDPTKKTKAPIYLLKVELMSVTSGYRMKQASDDSCWELNPMIPLLLAQVGVPTASDLPSEVDLGGLGTVLNSIEVLRLLCGPSAGVDDAYVLANISSADIRITRHLKEDVMARNLAGNDVVKAKLEARVIEPTVLPVGDAGIEGLGVVLPCDDSQLRVIQLSDQGVSLQVEGPPGTGKSQTIANIIANFILKDKKVLFVCEKAVAVAQVKERLERAGLGEALLYLHDENAERLAFVRQAAALAPRVPRPQDGSIAQLQDLRRQLNDGWIRGCSALHPAATDLAKQEGVAGLIRLKRELGEHLQMVEIHGHSAMTHQRLQELFRVVSEWTEMAGELKDGDSPWNHVRGELYQADPSSESKVRAAIKELLELDADLPALHEKLVRLGLIAPLVRLGDVVRAAHVARLVTSQPKVSQLLINCAQASSGNLSRLRLEWQELQTLQMRVHPVDFALFDEQSFSQSLGQLGRALGVAAERMSWEDLRALRQAMEADLTALATARGLARQLCDLMGARVTESVSELRQVVAAHENLRAVNLAVPMSWWTQEVPPGDQVASWRLRLKELADLCERTPWVASPSLAKPKVPDLVRMLGLEPDAFVSVYECAEGGEEPIFKYFRPSSDGKTFLRSLYGNSLPEGMRWRDWLDLCRHTLEVRDSLWRFHEASKALPAFVTLHEVFLAEPDKSGCSKILQSTQLRLLSALAKQVTDLRANRLFLANPGVAAAYWSNTEFGADRYANGLSTTLENRLVQLSGEFGFDDISVIRSVMENRHVALTNFMRTAAVNGTKSDMCLGETLSDGVRRKVLGRNLTAVEDYRAMRDVSPHWALKDSSDWDAAMRDVKWKEDLTLRLTGESIELAPVLWAELDAQLTDWLARRGKCAGCIRDIFEFAADEFDDFARARAICHGLHIGAVRQAAWLRKDYWYRSISRVSELQSFFQSMMTGRIEPRMAWKVFQFNFLHRCDVANGPRGQEHAQSLNQFAELDGKLAALSVAQLKRKLHEAQQKAASDFGPASAEIRRLSGLSRIMRSIREILRLEGMSGYLRAAKPCWMMSPASLSSFVGIDPANAQSASGPQFDVVVFDEASQMRVMEAVYCMSYAKQSVIVGDRKQLPPTNFFRGGLTDLDDTDDFVESVLEEFGGVFRDEGPMSTRVSLLSHYRSETPDLIAFNNARFYGGSLEVCPPRVVSGTGLKQEYVPAGRFVGQVNRAEAERIVELVVEHVTKRPDRSLGVVVMNYNQMELVEELLADAPGFVQLFMSDDESFFLRNLETVQGDEADYIILGLTYGKGEDGRFSASSLGPLTKNGGHRRLNVATSRSRLGMTVLSSLVDQDLAASSAVSEGFQGFREFLAYLRLSKTDNDFGITQKAPAESVGPSQELLACGKIFESEVIEFLQAAGLDVRPGYGAGRYRIDIVVRDGGRNILAVECDGASYHAIATARTRDRGRRELLQSKGWRFHRVWSRDWFHDRDAEQARLMAAVQEAREARGEPAKT